MRALLLGLLMLATMQAMSPAEIIRRTATPMLMAKALRRDWMMGRHLMAIDRALTDIAAGRLRRLIVEMPPRHGKSDLIGRYFPAWYLGTFPDRQVMYASYEAGQASKYGRFARNVLVEHGPSMFGVRVADDSSAADRWGIQGREGGMVTAGVGGPLTGKGADVLIIDDSVKNSEEALSENQREKIWDWYTGTAYDRLEPGGSIVLIQQRWHKDDLLGRAQREQAGEGWRVLRFPAIAEDNDPLGRRPGEALWPERVTLAQLHAMRAAMPLYWWQGKFQQSPIKHGAVKWPDEYFDGDDLWFDEWPESCRIRVASCDPSVGKEARKGDYSAIVSLAADHGRFDATTHPSTWPTIWIDASLDRRPAGKIVSDGMEIFRQFRPSEFCVESNGWQVLLGPMFVAELEAANLWNDIECFELNNSKNKETRIERLDPWLRNRKVRFRRSPGTRLLVSQLREFPLGTHDDGPDALEMAVRFLGQLHGGESEQPVGSPANRVRA